MDGKTMRRAMLTAVFMFAASQLPACQAFEAPTIKTGQRICSATTKAECDPLYEVSETLHTPDMERRIAEARR